MSQTIDPNALLMGGGKSFKFATPGDKVTGTVTDLTAAQQTDFATGKPLFWDDGNPKMQVIITLDTQLSEDAGDDGARRVYAKGQMLAAIKQAVKAAGQSKVELGGKLSVGYTGDGEAKGNNHPPKQYVAKYEPPAPVSAEAIADIFND